MKIKVLTDEQHDLANENNYNFDHPDAFDEKLLYNTLKDLLNGQTVKVSNKE